MRSFHEKAVFVNADVAAVFTDDRRSCRTFASLPSALAVKPSWLGAC
jgi:hypothetical protein